MHARRHLRLEHLAQHLAQRPLRDDVVAEEFDRFRHSGELPEDQRLAVAVVQLALRGGPAAEPSPMSLAETMARLPALVRELEEAAAEPQPPDRPPLRRILLREALRGEGVERQAARLALRIEVGRGGDVASREFLADRDPPEHASLGLHLLGFPECLATPPYVAQAQRLIARQAEIRTRLNHDDPAWFEPIAEAIRRFRREGELPDDELVLDCVLADGELLALVAHYGGVGDPEVLAAFDAAATNGPEETRAAALALLQKLAREGRLVPQLE
jgi:hypothetical protein